MLSCGRLGSEFMIRLDTPRVKNFDIKTEQRQFVFVSGFGCQKLSGRGGRYSSNTQFTSGNMTIGNRTIEARATT